MVLKNKTILIAGASSGIGRQVALQLSHAGNRLILCARRKELLDTLAEEIRGNGSEALSVPCDALSKESAAAAVSNAESEFGKIDAALLNIGDGPSFHMGNSSVSDVLDNMDLNYATLVHFLVPLIAHMKKHRDGVIAHTNSLAGFLGLPMQGPYSASKAAGRILMDTCRTELKSSNIRFVSLYPGFVATARVENDGIPSPFEISEEYAANCVIRGITREQPDYLFPRTTGGLIRLARILPKRVTSYILSKAVPAEY